MSVRCRAALAADQERVVALLAAQLEEHTLAPSDTALARAVAVLLRAPDLGRLLVAERDGALVGVAALSWTFSLEHGGRSAWLDELYVVPACRAGGVGTALLEAACDAARAAGALAVDLEVEAGHERVASLYARHGFVRHARERWYRRLAPASGPTADDPPALALEGGCLCGAIRYRLAATDDVTHCHCSLCRRSTGAPFVTWITVPASAFVVTAGRPVERRSTPAALRSFCGACGTAIAFREDARPDAVDVTAGSLDHPERVRPREHIHTDTRLPWAALHDGLPAWDGPSPREG